MAEMPNNIWVFNLVESFLEAINAQSQYADSQGLSWDRFGSIAAYVFSTYGIATLLMAVLLNRTMLLASATTATANNGFIQVLKTRSLRQSLILSGLRLLLLYILSQRAHDIIVTLSVVAINEKPGAISVLTSVISGFVHYDPVKYSSNKFMAMPRNEVIFGPTSAMLWPVFTSVSYSLFTEAFCCAILNKKPHLEGGISLFELSLAIQEMSSGFFFLRDFAIAKRPSEQVLIVCLFLVLDQMSSQIISLFFKNKYRLIPLIFLNMFFISYYMSNVKKGNLLMFPLNISVTYITLICTLWVSFVCLGILLLALLTKGFNLSQLNFTNYFAENHSDADFFADHLGLSFDQSFHDAVLNLGIFAVTLAGKSSYITEYSFVPLPRQTWLEDSILTQEKMAIDSLGAIQTDALINSKIAHLVTQGNGYGKEIKNPSPREITSFNLIKDSKPESNLKIRYKYFTEIVFRTSQLFKVYILQFIRYLRTKFLGYQAENRLEPPGFLRHLYYLDHDEDFKHNSGDMTAIVNYGDDKLALDLDEIDETPDYEYISETDDDEEEGDDDEESDFDALEVNLYKESPLTELLSPEGYIELLDNLELINQRWQLLKNSGGVLTRSRIRKWFPNPVNEAPGGGDISHLLNLIVSTRQEHKNEKSATKPVGILDDSLACLDSDSTRRLVCVICHTNPREIITWPCKCFAICEDCRLRLLTKNMEGCVCCRREVEGVSRIYLP